MLKRLLYILCWKHHRLTSCFFVFIRVVGWHSLWLNICTMYMACSLLVQMYWMNGDVHETEHMRKWEYKNCLYVCLCMCLCCNKLCLLAQLWGTAFRHRMGQVPVVGRYSFLWSIYAARFIMGLFNTCIVFMSARLYIIVCKVSNISECTKSMGTVPLYTQPIQYKVCYQRKAGCNVPQIVYHLRIMPVVC